MNRANILNCASIAYIGIAAPLMLDGFMQQILLVMTQMAGLLAVATIFIGSWPLVHEHISTGVGTGGIIAGFYEVRVVHVHAA